VLHDASRELADLAVGPGKERSNSWGCRVVGTGCKRDVRGGRFALQSLAISTYLPLPSVELSKLMLTMDTTVLMSGTDSRY
jgi:hypothetical protein